MDYKNGKIYAIRSNQTEKFYIGATTQPLCKRFYGHKHGLGFSSKELIDNYDDAYIELLESFPCENREQLYKRENELIREHKDNLVNKAGVRTCYKKYEYVKKNGEVSIKQYEGKKYDQSQYNKTFYEKHKDDIKTIHNCPCGRKYTYSNKSTHEKSKYHQLYKKLTEPIVI